MYWTVRLARLLFDPRGRVDRLTFVLIGLVLVPIKLAADFSMARFVFGQPWDVREYVWSKSLLAGLTNPSGPRLFYFSILCLAAPFAWIGICLCAKRLRGAGLSTWPVIFFFVPILKWFFFATAALLPPRAQPEAPAIRDPSIGWTRWLPQTAVGSAATAIFITVAVSLLIVLASIYLIPSYGFTLFIGVPFFTGFVSTALYGARARRSFAQSAGTSLLAVALLGVALLSVATEGIVCLFMALPLAAGEAVAGALIAHLLLEQSHHAADVILPNLALLPLLLMLEHAAPAPASLRAVVTDVRIAAPIETVWLHVVSFTEIPEPREWLFRAGIAYPKKARLDGEGIGAIRHCIFSTGEFVEPITVWDAPRRLAFDVTAQPDPMLELSPYGAIRTPHLRGYFRSERGEFYLVSMSAGETRLFGTTWYALHYQPELYWSLWSDYLIHRIHLRVLQHIKTQSEQEHNPQGKLPAALF
jgi:uncharacterized membrane protein YhaH (DUF805 family)